MIAPALTRGVLPDSATWISSWLRRDRSVREHNYGCRTINCFRYDSAGLQPSAIEQLRKLAVLIKRNPNARFTVEGYTDSFGSPEYNLDLSQRRADSVKQYLVQAMGISPAQIETRGYGQTKFLVPPNLNAGQSQPDIDAEIRRQQPNRRVVIVVHTKEG